uniref:Transmembrane protein 266 n=1 Tax=Canis lupus familiaris TaxID=9615 RepID=A0A8I3PNF3_CANLF
MPPALTPEQSPHPLLPHPRGPALTVTRAPAVGGPRGARSPEQHIGVRIGPDDASSGLPRPRGQQPGRPKAEPDRAADRGAGHLGLHRKQDRGVRRGCHHPVLGPYGGVHRGQRAQEPLGCHQPHYHAPDLAGEEGHRCLRPAREGGDGDGHPAVREGQGHPRRAAGEADTDLSGARGAAPGDSVNSYGSQYYNGPSSDSGVPEPAACVVTTAAIDVHQPNISSDLFSGDTPLQLSSNGTCASATSDGASRSTHSSVPQAQSHSSRTLGSCTDCSTAREEEEEEEPSSEPGPRPRPPPGRTAEATAQDLLSSPLEGPCPPQRALDPAPVSRPGPAGSAPSSPELERRLSLFNQKNPEGFAVFQIKPVVHFQPAAPALEDKFRSLESKEQKLHRVPEA